MYDKLREYIESLFKDAPDTVKTVELKEEMLQNLYVGGKCEQSLALACALSERMLKGSGASPSRAWGTWAT